VCSYLFHVFAGFRVHDLFDMLSSFYQPVMDSGIFGKFHFCTILFARCFFMLFSCCLHVLCQNSSIWFSNKVVAFVNELSIFFVVTMLDHCWLCSMVLKDICRSKSIEGAIGAKDFAAVKESGGRLNLCLKQSASDCIWLFKYTWQLTGTQAFLILRDSLCQAFYAENPSFAS
jgi:hypothetical protein